MIKQSITLEEVVAFLNELVVIDRAAMTALVETRVPCNEALADHPTVQVSCREDGARVGLLGILNGLFGVDERGYGAIGAQFSGIAGELGEVENFDVVVVPEKPTIAALEDGEKDAT